MKLRQKDRQPFRWSKHRNSKDCVCKRCHTARHKKFFGLKQDEIPAHLLSGFGTYHMIRFKLEVEQGYKEQDAAPAYVYLMGNYVLGYSKIGFSSDLGKRLEQLNGSLPFEVYELGSFEVQSNNSRSTAQSLEKLLHKKFSNRRLQGEWFFNISPKEFQRAAKEAKKKL